MTGELTPVQEWKHGNKMGTEGVVHVTPRRGFREQRRLKSLSETKPNQRCIKRKEGESISYMMMPWFAGWVYEALGVSTCLPPPFCCCTILTVGGSLSETSMIPLNMESHPLERQLA